MKKIQLLENRYGNNPGLAGDVLTLKDASAFAIEKSGKGIILTDEEIEIYEDDRKSQTVKEEKPKRTTRKKKVNKNENKTA